MNKKLIILFSLILFISNIFLIRGGLWFYQDTSGWFKTVYEARSYLEGIFGIFENGYFYSYGIDKGLLSFSGILHALITNILFQFFDSEIAQILFIYFGFIISFLSFYIFLGIFIKDKQYVKYVLSLIYVFIPLSYNLQGSVYLLASIPLYITSLHYFFKSLNGYLKYLLLNIISLFFVVSYIRLFEVNILIILPYFVYLLFVYRYKNLIKKMIFFILTYILISLPLSYTLISQFLENSNTAFGYSTLFEPFVGLIPMPNAYNLVQTFNLPIYLDLYSQLTGLFFFCYVIFLLINAKKAQKNNKFLLVNLFLILLGLTCYGFVNIFGKDLYPSFIKIFPFIINGHFWALYLIHIPLLMVVGLTNNKNKVFYLLTFIILIISFIPLWYINRFELKQFILEELPGPYKSLYLGEYRNKPEPTYYIMGSCWRAQYMKDKDIPTHCLNMQENFPSITFKNPRHLSGVDYYISELLYANININNLRITHNLKNIVVPNDIVEKRGPGPETGAEEINLAKKLRMNLDKNELLDSNSNENFNFYSFKNKNEYDFFIYSPLSLVYKGSPDSIADNLMDMSKRPAVIADKNYKDIELQNAKVFYKAPIHLPNKYYIKVKLENPNKPFALQFNQTYYDAWQLRFINKNEFDNVQCKTDIDNFSLTNNSTCRYNDSIMPLDSINLLSKSSLPLENHYRGNFIGNSWLFNPKDTRSIISGDEIYLVIHYQKQILYTYSIFVAFVSIVMLFFITILQEVYERIKK